MPYPNSISRVAKTDRKHLLAQAHSRGVAVAGREYYALHGSRLRPPACADQILRLENIRWHNEQIYLGA